MSVTRDDLQKAIHVARDIIARNGFQPPIDVEAIAYTLGVVRIEPRTMTPDGYLGRLSDGSLVIRYRDNMASARRRFTIAHEIGHILLASAQGLTVSDESFRTAEASDAEERAVNRIAAELIMPESLMKNWLRGTPVSWESIYRIRRAFSVSTTALLHRILELPNCPAVWLRIPNESNVSFRNEIRVLCSKWPRVIVDGQVGELAAKLLSRPRSGDLSVRVVTDRGPVTLQADLNKVSGIGPPETWVIAWQSG